MVLFSRPRSLTWSLLLGDTENFKRLFHQEIVRSPTSRGGFSRRETCKSKQTGPQERLTKSGKDYLSVLFPMKIYASSCAFYLEHVVQGPNVANAATLDIIAMENNPRPLRGLMVDSGDVIGFDPIIRRLLGQIQ
ncbi:hypothetical protein J3R82DRAFT_4967 [Butyriboletus roseoflavus]|nr:hypothetical protein J3R82DRAFT_4967 [Butyriboletus roseoflavus]